MKKIVLFILMMLPMAMLGQENKNDTTSFTEYHDGLLWVYCKKNNITVGTSCYIVHDNYGKYYQLSIYIKNEGNNSFIFQPENISAIIKKGKNKIKPLLVYSYNQYIRKIKNIQNLSVALNGFAIGLNSGMAGYKTANVSGWSPRTGFYSGTVNYYDSYAATSARIQGNMYLDQLEEKYKIDREIKPRGYLRTTTIHCGEDIFGYINIKKKAR